MGLRLELLASLVACTNAGHTADTVVVYDRVANGERARFRLDPDDEVSFAGCRLAYVHAHVVINCDPEEGNETIATLEPRVLSTDHPPRVSLRFACESHPKSRPLGLLLERVSYDVWCE
jgi:hypothetical protein